MAPHVVVSGTGTYATGSYIFQPGSTPCADEEALELVREANLDWVTVEELPISTVEVSTTAAEIPPATPATPAEVPSPAEAIIPNDALLAQVNKQVVDRHVAAEHTGKLEKSDLRKDGFPCRYCDKVLQSSAGQATHERVKHADEVAS